MEGEGEGELQEMEEELEEILEEELQEIVEEDLRSSCRENCYRSHSIANHPGQKKGRMEGELHIFDGSYYRNGRAAGQLNLRRTS